MLSLSRYFLSFSFHYFLFCLFCLPKNFSIIFQGVGDCVGVVFVQSVIERLEVQGCQIFLGTTYQHGKNLPNNHKIYQITIKYVCQMAAYVCNAPNCRKIDQMAVKYANIFHCKGPPKFTQIWIFGLKICTPSGNPGHGTKKCFDSRKSRSEMCLSELKKIQLSRIRFARVFHFFKVPRRKCFCFLNALGYSWHCAFLQRWRCNSRS
jgi:hypothetical protein